MTQISSAPCRIGRASCPAIPMRNPGRAAGEPARKKTRPAAWPAVLALLVGFATMAAPAQAADDPREAMSREYAQYLQTELGARLKAALAEDGPVGAIGVCQVQAPIIAMKLSGQRGGPARVGRTALKVRNPANAPDDEARAILLGFERALEAGETGLSRFIARPDGSARYLQAIPTQAPCLACHGSDLSPDVAQAIAARYPADEATGFALGELRGAFLIEWEVPGATP